MKEKKISVSSKHHRKRKQQRQSCFSWKWFIIIVLVVTVCIYVVIWFGEKIPFANSQSNDISITQETGDMQGDFSEKSTMTDMKDTTDDTNWNLMLVNNKSAIPENYEPKLVEVSDGEKVDERIYEPLMEMLEAAKEANLNQLPIVVSGYRTQKKQQKIFDKKIAEFRKKGHSKSESEELAKQWVAIPGYSEHQIGLAVDINGATYDLYFWLQENSYKYGFIFRYPGDKTDITGVSEEVWHYRYVGVKAATEMYERGICLEEYLAEEL